LSSTEEDVERLVVDCGFDASHVFAECGAVDVMGHVQAIALQ
jgi:hypothetical protein